MGKTVKISKKAEPSISVRWDAVMQSNYGTPVLDLVRGKGIEVWDSNGKKYLDFLGGIATNLLGHAHPKVSAAISTQSEKLSHISNFYSHQPEIGRAHV